MPRPYYVDSDVVHSAHYYDGYPLCWPMTAEGEHTSTQTATAVTCPGCLEHLAKP